MNVCAALWQLLVATSLGQVVTAEPFGDRPFPAELVMGADHQLSEVKCLVSSPPLVDRRRILLIGGIDGAKASAELARSVWSRLAKEIGTDTSLLAVAVDPASEPSLDKDYPPKDAVYNTSKRPVANYLWRWAGLCAPDVVVEIRQGAEFAISIPDQGCARLRELFPEASSLPASSELVSVVPRSPAALVGTIPAMRVTGSSAEDERLLEALRGVIGDKQSPRSAAAIEMSNRLSRKPIQVVEQLAKVYGHNLDSVSYIPALAMMGRLRLADLQGIEDTLPDVLRIVEPYSTGAKSTLGERPNSTVVAGHLFFADLAARTGKAEFLKLAKLAADTGFENGQPKESMPYHSEMSDAVFMGCPILASVGKLTGDSRYLDMAYKHFEFMKKLTLRSDNIYRHSPLDEGAWGRGNGFPALGLALTLSDLPNDHPGFAPMLQAFQRHMAALIEHQDPTGHWHQVIDHPASYRELTSTCMIGFAMARGVRRGWLDEQRFGRWGATRAWKAVLGRVADDGTLVDVCTGTGKQPSLRAYFDREAILGKDGRGGAMVMTFALEMHELQANK